MDSVVIKPSKIAGEVKIIPSKSVSHRALIAAALAKGRSEIRNIVFSEDVRATTDALSALGICQISREDSGVFVMGGLNNPRADRIFCGESGSTLRFLIPLSLIEGGGVFTGAGRLLSRPMSPYERLFTAKGMLWSADAEKIEVRGTLAPGVYELPGDVSSQFLSGLMMALPLLGEDSEIAVTSPLESAGYADVTAAVLEAFGVTVSKTPGGYRVPGGGRYRPGTFTVEGDYSHAAFFIAMGAISGGVRVMGLPEASKQPDSAVIGIVRRMGGDVRLVPGGLTAEKSALSGVDIEVSQCPDLVPALAVLGCAASGVTRLTGAARLRDKESDRLRAMAELLGNLGASVKEGADFLEIHGGKPLRGGRCGSANDHRVAMAAAVASCLCREPVELSGAASVKKSAPRFWDEFRRIGGIVK